MAFLRNHKFELLIIFAAVLIYFPFRNASEEDASKLTSYVLFLTLIAIVWYSWETRQLRRLTEVRAYPYVFISLQPLESSPGLLNLVVHNIGSGPAYDLKFAVDSKILLLTGTPLSEINFIKNGLKYLAPDHKIQCLFENLYGKKQETITPAEVRITYRDVSHKPFAEVFILDPTDYTGRLRVNEPTLKDLIDKIEKIHADLARVITGAPNPKIRIVAYTREEMKEKIKKILEEHEAAESGEPGLPKSE